MGLGEETTTCCCQRPSAFFSGQPFLKVVPPMRSQKSVSVTSGFTIECTRRYSTSISSRKTPKT